MFFRVSYIEFNSRKDYILLNLSILVRVADVVDRVSLGAYYRTWGWYNPIQAYSFKLGASLNYGSRAVLFLTKKGPYEVGESFLVPAASFYTLSRRNNTELPSEGF